MITWLKIKDCLKLQLLNTIIDVMKRNNNIFFPSNWPQLTGFRISFFYHILQQLKLSITVSEKKRSTHNKTLGES